MNFGLDKSAHNNTVAEVTGGGFVSNSFTGAVGDYLPQLVFTTTSMDCGVTTNLDGEQRTLFCGDVSTPEDPTVINNFTGYWN